MATIACTLKEKVFKHVKNCPVCVVYCKRKGKKFYEILIGRPCISRINVLVIVKIFFQT